MGVSEHLVDDGNGTELNISCPDYEEDSYVRAYAKIGGRQYRLRCDRRRRDLQLSFFTDCRICGANFPNFWEALRKANNLKLAAGGQTINLPTQNITTVLQPLDGLVRQPARRRRLSPGVETLFHAIKESRSESMSDAKNSTNLWFRT